MKLQITVKVIALTDLRSEDFSRLPKDTLSAINRMPATEKANRSLLSIDTFPPRIIDTKTVNRYFPMLVPRTFQEALALLRDCDNLYMCRGGLQISWSKLNYAFLDNAGNTWTPGPDVILSNKEEWYVYSKNQSDQAEAGFPDL